MTRLSPVFLATAFALAFSTPVFSQDAKPEVQLKSQPGAGDVDEGTEHKAAPHTEDQDADADRTVPQPERKLVFEGTMTLEKMGKILRRLDDNAARMKNGWRLTIDETPVVVVTDQKHGRMRILVAVRKADNMLPDDLNRLMQANFDTALDARYAIAHGIVWATYIHPLRELHDRQLITAVGQTVNLSKTYGTSFSSGALSFSGGDSNDIMRRQLIEQLLKKGQAT